jgi:hypothetical protein
VVPGARLYPLVPPLPVLSSLKPDHLLSAVLSAYALPADVGRAEMDDDAPELGQIAIHTHDLPRAARSGSSTSSRQEPHLIARTPDHELWMTFFAIPTATCSG